MSQSWIFGAAEVCNRIYGPIPGGIIETQGAHLLTRPSTPLIHDGRAPSNAPDFLSRLDSKLNALLLGERLRRHIYGVEVADDTVMGFTPPEVRAERKLRLAQTLREIEEENGLSTPPTPATSAEAEESNSQNHDMEKQVKKAETVHTPPDSEEDRNSPLYNQHGEGRRKRRREDPNIPLSDTSPATTFTEKTLSLEPSVSNKSASCQATHSSKRTRIFSDPGSDRTKKAKVFCEQQQDKHMIQEVAG